MFMGDTRKKSMVQPLFEKSDKRGKNAGVGGSLGREKEKPFFRGERKELLNGAGFDICEELTPQGAEKFFCRENLLSGRNFVRSRR